MYKFSQQHTETINYFKFINSKYTSIDIESFPHYKYLIGDKLQLIKYLNISWKLHYPKANKNKIDKLINNHIEELDDYCKKYKYKNILK